MTGTKEAGTQQPTLNGWIDSTISEFRGRYVNESGFPPWELGHAVLKVLKASGLTSHEMFVIANQETDLDPESLKVLALEANTSTDPGLILTAKIILEEINSKHPEVKAENDERVERARTAFSRTS